MPHIQFVSAKLCLAGLRKERDGHPFDILETSVSQVVDESMMTDADANRT
jgi:hypothetical protein